MKKTLIAVLGIIFLSNCSTSIKSIVDRDAIQHPYKNPLIIIPFEPGSIENFCNNLKEKLDLNMEADSTKADFFLFENKKKGLVLNEKNDVNEQINSLINDDKRDVAIVFKPTHYYFSNGSIQSIVYEITATDIFTKKEVWKSEFKLFGSFGISGLADKSAKEIFGRLKGDGVL